MLRLPGVFFSTCSGGPFNSKTESKPHQIVSIHCQMSLNKLVESRVGEVGQFSGMVADCSFSCSCFVMVQVAMEVKVACEAQSLPFFGTCFG